MSGTLVEDPRPVDEHDERVERRLVRGPGRSPVRVTVSLDLRATRAIAGLVCMAGLVFLFFGNRPLGQSDVWGQLVYGRTISQLRSLPTTEPLLPLAKGMPFVDTAWLSQLIVLGVMDGAGVAGLKSLYAASIAVCVALLAWSSYRTSRNGSVAAYAVLAFLLVAWDSLSALQAPLAGLVCFVALLSRCTGRQTRAGDWLLIPVLFAAWANLHVSFVFGLCLLACFAVGRMLDVLRRTGSLKLTLCDTRARRNMLLLELAAVAVLLNPYGPGLYAEVLSHSMNPNLRDLAEWKPLSVRTFAGQMFVLVVVVLAMIYRWSPRRVRTWEVLALAGFGVASLWSSGNLIWWASIAALLLAQHAYSTMRAVQHLAFAGKPVPRRALWSAVIVGILGFCFAYSPLGGRLLSGKETELKRAVAVGTPVAATEYLKAHPPRGLVFNVHEWGDYLHWAGPPGIELFANSSVHLVPLDVWLRYQQVLDQRGNWEEVLDRFAVNTIVLDTRRHGSLVAMLKHKAEVWNPAFEQDGQVILTRRKAL